MQFALFFTESEVSLQALFHPPPDLKYTSFILTQVRYFQAWTESLSPEEQQEGEEEGAGEWGTFSTTPAGVFLLLFSMYIALCSPIKASFQALFSLFLWLVLLT